jgi:hypothetical protein
LSTKTWILAAFIALLSFAAAAPAAADDGPTAGPQPLTGEALLASELGTPGTSTVTGTCNPFGTSTFQFTVTGQALGPYPGTFTESGTFSFGPFGLPDVGFGVGEFESTFTISSAAGSVHGTKELTVPGTGFGACGIAAFPTGGANAIDFEGVLTYSAHITTPGGPATDSGESFVNYGDSQLRGVIGFNGFNFDESFTSTSFEPGCRQDNDHQGDDHCEDEDY